MWTLSGAYAIFLQYSAVAIGTRVKISFEKGFFWYKQTGACGARTVYAEIVSGDLNHCYVWNFFLLNIRWLNVIREPLVSEVGNTSYFLFICFLDFFNKMLFLTYLILQCRKLKNKKSIFNSFIFLFEIYSTLYRVRTLMCFFQEWFSNIFSQKNKSWLSTRNFTLFKGDFL